ncbi:Uma2 family endonuclease [Persicitalea jodogahamensis]|uniref:Putative restriction endonuclease domain-containing protein n=1 Tax=Persicitalea jodogahamensis TaxID=402147 RepID=A0A8J3CZJ7_9BACT|nr:Uma2 family endonuclease [Persicitalea jodogahamensis]GHB52825.1 hypothetical protein GCM10007390_01870 [Persicitalea jodogahamensis]
MIFENRVNDLLEAPDALLVIERAQAILADESNRRLAFREWLTDDVKAEFINGEVIMHSPVKRRHLDATKYLENLLLNHVMRHDLGVVDSEKALVGLTRNDYEPDICYWNAKTAAAFSDDQTEHPAPDLIVEVFSKSTTGRDRGVKFEDYAAHGVLEYWIIDPVRKAVEQYTLDEGTMAFAKAAVLYDDANDMLSAEVVEGFTIPVRAIFDKKANMDALQELMAR